MKTRTRPEKTADALVAIAGELAVHDYSIFDLTSRYGGARIAVQIEPAGDAQYSAIVFRSVRIRGKAVIEALPLEVPMHGRALRALMHLQRALPWAQVCLGESFNTITPGGPYGWFELPKRAQVVEQLEALGISYKELSRKKPIRRVKVKLARALQEDKPEVHLVVSPSPQHLRLKPSLGARARAYSHAQQMREDAKKYWP